MKIASKTGTGLGVLAALACAACCALPILIAGGILSGTAAALLAGRMPIIAIILAVLAAITFTLTTRRKTSACGDACAAQGECACTRTPA